MTKNTKQAIAGISLFAWIVGVYFLGVWAGSMNVKWETSVSICGKDNTACLQRVMDCMGGKAAINTCINK